MCKNFLQHQSLGKEFQMLNRYLPTNTVRQIDHNDFSKVSYVSTFFNIYLILLH